MEGGVASPALSHRMCCRCEERQATVDCVDCGRALNGEQSAYLCHECLTTLHNALGKFASKHLVTSLQLQEIKQTVVLQLEDMKKAIANCELVHMGKTAALVEETRDSCTTLQSEVQVVMEYLRQLLALKEREVLESIGQAKDYKVEMLSQKKQFYTSLVQEARKLVQEVEEELSLPIAELQAKKGIIETQLAQLQQYQDNLTRPSSPPPPSLSTSLCGFLPDTSLIQQALSHLVVIHQKEVEVGDKFPAFVVGSLNPQGVFWVRILPDGTGLQDVMLLNISIAIGMELSVTQCGPLPSPHPGQLCCARYSHDQRWYRARIESLPRPGRAIVYFMDYGNSEDMPLSSLAPLPDKYCVFPFQMMQCCFTDNPAISFEKREVKWGFRDNTQDKRLSVTVLKKLPGNHLGPLHMAHLLNENYPEAFDIGATVMAISEATSAAREAHPLKYRDIRYKDQPPKIVTVSSKSPPTLPPPSTTPSVPEEGCEGEGVSPAGEPEEEQRDPDHQSTLESDSPALPVPGSMPEEQGQTNGHSPSPPHPEEQGQTYRHSPSPPHPEGVGATSEDTQEPSIPAKKPRAEVKPLKLRESHSDPTELDGGFDTVNSQDFDSETPVPESELTSTVTSTEYLTAAESVVNSSSGESVQDSTTALDIKPDAELQVYVTTGLSKDGSFWAQLETTSVFEELMRRLQKQATEVKELYTPVFFSEGDHCAALFSEDELWYRAFIEKADQGVFTVRFMDFGNSEDRGHEHLQPLRSQFRELPYQAMKCSIATEDHPTFTQQEKDKFDEIIPQEEPVLARVLQLKEGEKAVSVQLLLPLEGKEPLDLHEEIYTADVSTIPSMNFSLSGKSSFDHGLPSSHQPVTDWAEHMDALESPRADGFLTLPGTESSLHASTPPPPPRETAEERRRNKADSCRLPAHSQHPPREERSRGRPTSSGSSGEGPRLNLGIAKRSILAGLGAVREGDQRRARSAERMPDRRRERVERTPHRVPPTDCGHQMLSGSLTELWDYATPPRQGSPLATPRGRRSPDPDPTQVKLFVKYMPHLKSREEVAELFGKYGTVYLLEYHSEHRDKLYLIMDKEGGRKAIAALHGAQLHGSPMALSVQKYKSLGTPSPSPPWQSPSGSLDNLSADEQIRLFVKHIPSNKTADDLHAIFSTHGKVLEVVQHPSRRNVTYVYMDPAGGRRAIDALHGKAIAKNTKPLIVEISHDPSPWKGSKPERDFPNKLSSTQ